MTDKEMSERVIVFRQGAAKFRTVLASSNSSIIIERKEWDACFNDRWVCPQEDEILLRGALVAAMDRHRITVQCKNDFRNMWDRWYKRSEHYRRKCKALEKRLQKEKE